MSQWVRLLLCKHACLSKKLWMMGCTHPPVLGGRGNEDRRSLLTNQFHQGTLSPKIRWRAIEEHLTLTAVLHTRVHGHSATHVSTLHRDGRSPGAPANILQIMAKGWATQCIRGTPMPRHGGIIHYGRLPGLHDLRIKMRGPWKPEAGLESLQWS